MKRPLWLPYWLRAGAAVTALARLLFSDLTIVARVLVLAALARSSVSIVGSLRTQVGYAFRGQNGLFVVKLRGRAYWIYVSANFRGRACSLAAAHWNC